jgi:undecaprenyl-diphosphatase
LIDALTQWDARMFVLVNRSAGPFLDALMPWITQVGHFYVPLGILWLVLFWRGGRQERIFLVGILATVGLSDVISSHLIKPLVDRVRPCHTIEPVRLFFSCKKSPAFPSSHAVNVACAGFLLGARRRWLILPVVPLALAVGYSRIYVGLHYPLDVLGGYAIGLAIGAAAWLVLRKVMDRAGGPAPEVAPDSGD